MKFHLISSQVLRSSLLPVQEHDGVINDTSFPPNCFGRFQKILPRRRHIV
jgi:hypothetical protein